MTLVIGFGLWPVHRSIRCGLVAGQEPAPNAHGPLTEFVRRADPDTRFEIVVGQGDLGSEKWLTARLRSQRWRGVAWTHELSLFRPASPLSTELHDYAVLISTHLA